jgi:hypothetical protein
MLLVVQTIVTAHGPPYFAPGWRFRAAACNPWWFIWHAIRLVALQHSSSEGTVCLSSSTYTNQSASIFPSHMRSLYTHGLPFLASSSSAIHQGLDGDERKRTNTHITMIPSFPDDLLKFFRIELCEIHTREAAYQWVQKEVQKHFNDVKIGHERPRFKNPHADGSVW